ncbi:MAG TPA: SDR family oxidoreductase [Kofleriaceae bacterium]
MKRLLGKFALVTGGTSGIGAACAEALASEGAGVLATGRRVDEGPTAHPTLGQVAHAHLDVTDEESCARIVDAMPQLDLLVCAAGVGSFTSILTTKTSAVRAMLDVHILGLLNVARPALSRMQAKKAGHIVVIGSHVAHRSFTDCGGYTAAKAGQLGLTRVLAEEARPYNIRVTSILPGATDTPIWDDRPGFDRSKMMQPSDVAGFMISLVARPGMSVEEVTIMPPAGAL